MKNNDNLLVAIKNGDKESFTTLLEENKGLIYRIINDFNLDRGDFKIDEDSLFQEGSIALYNSVFSYDETRGMKFTSYAYMVVQSAILAYIRKQKRRYESESNSIDIYEDTDYLSCVKSHRVSDNPTLVFRENQLSEYLNKFYNKMPEIDQKIIELKKRNYSYEEISKQLGINCKKVDNRIRRLRKNLKFHIENEDSKTYLSYLRKEAKE